MDILHSPIIFLHWNDLQYYIEEMTKNASSTTKKTTTSKANGMGAKDSDDEDHRQDDGGACDNKIDYQDFDQLIDAVKYIEKYISSSQSSSSLPQRSQQEQQHKTSTDVSTTNASTASSSKRRSTASAASTSSLVQEKTNNNNKGKRRSTRASSAGREEEEESPTTSATTATKAAKRRTAAATTTRANDSTSSSLSSTVHTTKPATADVEQAEEPPKKRKRGRPPGPAKKPYPKRRKKRDQGEEEDDDDEDDDDKKQKKKAKSNHNKSSSSTTVLLTKQELERVKKQKFNDDFKKYTNMLQQFKTEYGDCDVPRFSNRAYKGSNGAVIDMEKYKGLGVWVLRIRPQLKIYQVNKHLSQLSGEQARKLLSVGFVLEPQRQKTKKDIWKEDMYNELVEYHKTHGHVNVPTQPFTKLVGWMRKIRRTILDYEDDNDNDTHNANANTCIYEELTEENKTKLEQLGFTVTKRKFSTFDDHVTRFLAYRAENNGQYPPATSYSGRWITGIRWEYKHKFLKGLLDETTLTQSQVDKLNSLGFEWYSQFKAPKRTHATKTFEERVQELNDYKTKFGDTLVPQAYPGLGEWVSRMRYDYKKYLVGEKSCITPQRVEILTNAGFVFEKQPRGSRHRSNPDHPLHTSNLKPSSTATDTSKNETTPTNATEGAVAEGEGETAAIAAAAGGNATYTNDSTIPPVVGVNNSDTRNVAAAASSALDSISPHPSHLFTSPRMDGMVSDDQLRPSRMQYQIENTTAGGGGGTNPSNHYYNNDDSDDDDEESHGYW